MITPVSIEPAAHIARLGARQRAVRLQRRRFWREVVYGGMIVASDAVTLAAVFIVLAMVPLSQVGQWLGMGGLVSSKTSERTSSLRCKRCAVSLSGSWLA